MQHAIPCLLARIWPWRRWMAPWFSTCGQCHLGWLVGRITVKVSWFVHLHHVPAGSFSLRGFWCTQWAVLLHTYIFFPDVVEFFRGGEGVILEAYSYFDTCHIPHIYLLICHLFWTSFSPSYTHLFTAVASSVSSCLAIYSGPVLPCLIQWSLTLSKVSLHTLSTCWIRSLAVKYPSQFFPALKMIQASLHSPRISVQLPLSKN